MTKLSDEQRCELDVLAKLPDPEIDTSDAPEVHDFTNAVRGRFYRPTERSVTVRIDADLLDWFASRGEAVQSHINAALRDYVEHRQQG
jgi:uncharacterized protein (DUF4415 family)